MVSKTGDIPSKEDVEPSGWSLSDIFEDILESGEVEVHLVNGDEYELHGHDTYVFEDPDMVYTKSGDEDVWFFLGDVSSIHRHYE